MTKKEWMRLRQYHHAKSFRPPRSNIPSKRSVKSMSQGVGLVMPNSYIRSQVPLERYFKKYK